jgi:hypothetical protein
MSIFAFVFVQHKRLHRAVVFLEGLKDAPRDGRESREKAFKNAVGTP